jgi:hypothetical protein
MEVDGQLHTLAGLLSGKKPPVPIRQGTGSRYRPGDKKKISAPARNQTPVVQPVA